MNQYSGSIRTKSVINGFIVSFTLVIAFWAFISPAAIESIQWYIIAVLLILIGIPHGATDHLIFFQLTRNKAFGNKTAVFLIGYLAIIALYVLVWYLSSSVALLIFLSIAAYHFGQSNLEHINFPHKSILRIPAYLLSGIFVIFVPIIYKYDETDPILSSILGHSPFVVEAVLELRNPIVMAIILLNVLSFGLILFRKYINGTEFWREMLNLLVLSLLFISAPMLLAFIVYFGLWHSLNSTLMQIKTLRSVHHSFGWLDFYRNALPYSLLAFAGMALLFYLSQILNFGISYIALFFVIISTVTLPHMLLIDRFHKLH